VCEEKSEPPKPSTPPINVLNILGHNYGNAGVGSHFQQVQIKNEFNYAIDKLLRGVADSVNLTPVQKMTVVNDIKVLQQLSEMEKTPEVVEVANSKIEFVNSVISSTADIVSLGMILIPIIRAGFGL
jgi:hypothetical protein